jgi:hypothetical protein
VTKPKNYVFIFATFGFFHNFEQVSRNFVHFCKFLRILCKTCVFSVEKLGGGSLANYSIVFVHGYRSSGVCCQGYGCVTGDAVVIVAGTVAIDAPAPAPMPYLHFILGFLRKVGKVSKV